MTSRRHVAAFLLALAPLTAQNIVYYDSLSPTTGNANAFPFGAEGCRVQQLVPAPVVGGPALIRDIYVNPRISSSTTFNVSQVYYADFEIRMGLTTLNSLTTDWNTNSPNPTTVYRGPLLVRFERDQWIPLGIPGDYLWAPASPQENLVIDFICWDVADTGIVPPGPSGFFLDTRVSEFGTISRAFHINWVQTQAAQATGTDGFGAKIGLLRNDGNFVSHDGSCPGSNAMIPQISATSGSFPQGGQPFDLLLGNGPANSIAVPILSTQVGSYLGIPLPFDLFPVGAFGCTMWHGWELLGPPVITDGTGAGTLTLTLPNLSGVIYATWLCLDPNANAFGFVPSGYAAMKI